jgi:hypothetical protein
MAATWSEILRVLEAHGFDNEVIETVRRSTALLRHKQRARVARNVALNYVLNAICHRKQETGASFDSLDGIRQLLGAYVLLTAEAGGLYGGGYTNPGDGTSRHRAFAQLGKGRRQASDGPAWTAAIQQAAWEVKETLMRRARAHPLDQWGIRYYADDDGQNMYAEVYGTGLPEPCSIAITPDILDYSEAATYVHRMILDEEIDDVQGSVLLACMFKRIRETQADTTTEPEYDSAQLHDDNTLPHPVEPSV